MRRSTIGALLLLALTLGMASCSSTEDSLDAVGTSVDESSVAYGYFGSVQLAKGSTINTTIQKVDSSADVTVVEAPEGFSVTVIDDADGTTRLEVKVAKDASTGPQVVTFDIEGEPEPVDWTIHITG